MTTNDTNTHRDLAAYAAFVEVGAKLAASSAISPGAAVAIMRDLSERDRAVEVQALREAAQAVPDSWTATWLEQRANDLEGGDEA